jgi:hypothetical protein
MSERVISRQFRMSGRPPHDMPVPVSDIGQTSASRTVASSVATVQEAPPTPTPYTVKPAISAISPCDKPDGLGVSHIVQIDTTGGPRFLIDHELPRATQCFEETLGIGNWTQLVSLAGATEIWDVDLVGVSHPRECLSKLIKGRFIGHVRYEHEPHFECWRSLLKDRMESRLETCRADSDRPIARLVRHAIVAPKEPKLRLVIATRSGSISFRDCSQSMHALPVSSQ